MNSELLIVLMSFLAIVAIVALVGGYLTLYAYGVVLAAKAHPAWIVVAVFFGFISVLAAIIYLLTKKNLFLLVSRKG